ncbi:MAG: quinone oxidoreductase, partial [Myxococcota bacterium]
TYTADTHDLRRRASRWFALLRSGQINVAVNARFPLQHAPTAHRAIEHRKISGSVLLTVES